MDEGSAYESTFGVVHGPFSSSPSSGPGDVTDADDEHLCTLRRTIAEPVVRSLLTDDELERITVHQDVRDDLDGVWVVVVAVGEVFNGWLNRPSPPDAEDGWTPQRCAEHLADSLEGWIAESRFAWGQQRTARYVLPPA